MALEIREERRVEADSAGGVDETALEEEALAEGLETALDAALVALLFDETTGEGGSATGIDLTFFLASLAASFSCCSKRYCSTRATYE